MADHRKNAQKHGDGEGAEDAARFFLSDDDLERLMAAVGQGVTPGDALGFTTSETENFYSLAYQHYVAGNFEDAKRLFQFLCQLKTLDVRFWMGLAGCLQGMGTYQDAIDAYSMAATAEGFDSPLPFLYIAMCFVQLNDGEGARTVLNSLLVLGDKNNPTHAACHEKATHMLQLLDAGKKEASHA